MKKRILASIISACLTMSMASTAFARSSDGITGEGTMEDVTISITVPTNLDFALDPAQTTIGPSQISNKDYSFENADDFAVLVAFYLDIEVAEGVTLKADADMDGYAAFGASAKELSFGAIVAASDDGTDVVYDDENADSIVEADNGYLEFGIVLAGAKVAIDGTITDGDEVTDDNEEDLNASFQFFSRMNAYADWKDSDVTVSGVYLLAPVNPATLKVAGTIVDDTTGLVGVDLPSVTPPYGFQAGTGMSAIDNSGTYEFRSVTYAGYAEVAITDVGILAGTAKIPFALNGATVDAIYYCAAGADQATVAEVLTAFTIENDGIVFNSDASWELLDQGNHELYIVLDNEDSFVVLVNKTNE